jgi:hypothetical protein
MIVHKVLSAQDRVLRINAQPRRKREMLLKNKISQGINQRNRVDLNKIANREITEQIINKGIRM